VTQRAFASSATFIYGLCQDFQKEVLVADDLPSLATLAVTSITSSDSSLTPSASVGDVSLVLNVAHANTWSAVQTYSADIKASADGSMSIGSTSSNRPYANLHAMQIGYSGSLIAGNMYFGNSTSLFFFQAGGSISLSSGCRMTFSSGVSNATAPDVGIKRASTGVLAINDAASDSGGVSVDTGLALTAKSSTTNDRSRFLLQSAAVDNTDASRTYQVTFSVYYTSTAQEGIRLTASSSGVTVTIGNDANYKGLVINENGNDADTRIEGDTDANLVFVDASADAVGIGTATPTAGTKLDVNGAIRTTSLRVAGTSVTISSGSIAYNSSRLNIDTEAAAASDDLDTITGGTAGDIAILRSRNSARDVVVKHATGNIVLNASADFTLDTVNARLMLEFDGTVWVELARSQP
jgi:hypothetical protein